MTSNTSSDPLSTVLEFNTGTPELDELLKTTDEKLEILHRNANQCINVTISRAAGPDLDHYIVSHPSPHELFVRHTIDGIAEIANATVKQSRRDVLRTIYMEGKTTQIDMISIDTVDRLSLSGKIDPIDDTQLSHLHREIAQETIS